MIGIVREDDTGGELNIVFDHIAVEKQHFHQTACKADRVGIFPECEF